MGDAPHSKPPALPAPAEAAVSPSTPAAEAAPAAPIDVMLVHGVTEDGQGLQVLRRRPDSLEAGVVRRLREGQPIHGEVLKLRPRPECPVLCDVEVALPAPEALERVKAKGDDLVRRLSESSSGRGRPAQVASDRYRENWDRIFSSTRKKGEAVN